MDITPMMGQFERLGEKEILIVKKCPKYSIEGVDVLQRLTGTGYFFGLNCGRIRVSAKNSSNILDVLRR
jgi:hypothetical protein